ncbi:MAG: hypothetical protein P4L79_10670 [Legionella sp.]|uniref:hypothetical protein n=1 Tax=Legionella sp. TaxID=459 RepID=UPI002850AAEC|nr:hypothetical protein [Legionella sp.]
MSKFEGMNQKVGRLSNEIEYLKECIREEREKEQRRIMTIIKGYYDNCVANVEVHRPPYMGVNEEIAYLNEQFSIVLQELMETIIRIEPIGG